MELVPPQESKLVSRRRAVELLSLLALAGSIWFAWHEIKLHQGDRLRTQQQARLVAEAEQRRSTNEQRLRLEQQQWTATLSADSETAYLSYLAAWPEGTHIAEAKAAIDKYRRKEKVRQRAVQTQLAAETEKRAKELKRLAQAVEFMSVHDDKVCSTALPQIHASPRLIEERVIERKAVVRFSRQLGSNNSSAK
jgi:Rps23 Pro-64 3,4-dihydroxylase Tpa1-like proline 4-hydroxylase